MTERLQELLKEVGMSASQFADRIGVQRSGISHILNGRNKPSLDLIQKILKTFPGVSAEWLVMGRGDPPGTGIQDLGSSETLDMDIETAPALPEKEKGPDKGPVSVEKVIVFYSDKTIEVYHQRD